MAQKKAKKQTKKSASSSELSKLNDSREFIFKVHSIGRNDVEEEQAREAFHLQERVFGNKGAIVPPYAFESLAFLLENSNSLRQNIDSYVTNIDSFGHRFEPVFSLDGKQAETMVRDAIFIENLTAAENAQLVAGASDQPVDPINDKDLEPKDDEVVERMKQLRSAARREKSKLRQFFDFVNVKDSFVKIRRKSRQDKELMGNAFWEILENGQGELASVSHVPAIHVRMLPLDKKPTTVKFRTKLTPITFQTELRQVKFRKFIQILPNTGSASHTAGHTYFREFGDERLMSADTGKRFVSLEAMEAKEPGARSATQMMHFKIHSSISPYGVPRWIGNLISVMGSRQAEEVNFFYFENKAVPPLALLVSGGRLAKGVVAKIQDLVENHLKGRRNFHKILIIEAETSRSRGMSDNNGRVQISLEPLTGAQHQDQLFQQYDENNIAKVSASFRVPKILRGETKDFNRATAEAAKIFAEEQVFQPERDDFDDDMNRQIMAALKVRFFTFKSNAPITRDPTKMTKNITDMVKASILTPDEGRFLAEDVFNVEFIKIDEPWVKQPIEVTKAGFVPQGFEQSELFAAEDDDVEKADLTTGDLDEGGKKVPSQARIKVPPSIQSSVREVLDELKRLGIVGKDATIDDLKGVFARIAQNKGKYNGDKKPKKKDDGKEEQEETLVIQISASEMSDLVERK